MDRISPSRQRKIQHHSPQQHHNPYFDHTSTQQHKPSAIKQWIKKDGLAFIGIIVLIAATLYYWLIASQRFVLTQLTVQPTQFIPQERIQQTIQNYLANNWLWIIPRNTYWTVNPEVLKKELNDTLSQEFSINVVEVSKVYPNVLLVSIQERIPSIRWITVAESGEEHQYTVDRNGIIASTSLDAKTVEQLPKIYDRNRTTLSDGWWIISSDYIDFLLNVHEQLPTIIAGATINFYELPTVDCTERRIVAEKVFESEILESSSQEFKEKKRAVQERFKNGELTVDQSLEELERIKQEELTKIGEPNNSNGAQQLQWAAVTVDIECDLVKVATQLNVTLTLNDNSIVLNLDRMTDLAIQLENARTIIRQQVPTKKNIRIDVRIPDRAFIQ